MFLNNLTSLSSKLQLVNNVIKVLQQKQSILVTSYRSYVHKHQYSLMSPIIHGYDFLELPSNYASVRKLSYFKHKYSAEVETLVNRQIQAEQQAAQDYLSIAVVFLHPSIGRPGAGGFFMKMYKEELDHMQDFVQYQLLRGGNVVIDSLAAPPDTKNLTLLEAFNRALAMEKKVTELLEELVKVAEDVKDYQCADYVTSIFLAEQMKSVNEMAHHVTKLSKLSNEHAIYHYDLELVKSHLFTYKPRTR